MEEIKTYIFQKDKKRTIKRLSYNLTILLAFGGIIYMFLIGILGIGLSLIGAISLTVALIKMKNYDDKYMGITAYGDRKAELIIAEDYFIIDNVKIPLSELSDLVIYVEEYAGQPRDFIGVHHGGNNEITFTHKGKKFSINYIIKDKSDFIEIEKLVDKIEKKQKLTLSSSNKSRKA